MGDIEETPGWIEDFHRQFREELFEQSTIIYTSLWVAKLVEKHDVEPILESLVL